MPKAIPTSVACENCKGGGAWPLASGKPCRGCNGKGEVPPTELRTVLRAARVREKLSMQDLAERTQTSSAHISMIENGQIAAPAWVHVVRIAKALDLDIRQLAEFT